MVREAEENTSDQKRNKRKNKILTLIAILL